MAVSSIQDRTNEFRSVLTQFQKRQASSKVGAQRQSLLTDSQKAAANGNANGDGKPRRSEFARRAAEIGRGIGGTMSKLEKLAQLAKRKTLFDDRPVEINELTFIIKQDLSSLNQQISSLQTLSRAQHPKADQEGEHNRNVVFMLQGKLTDDINSSGDGGIHGQLLKNNGFQGVRTSYGHPAPYTIPYIEIGNEDNVSSGCSTYAFRFTAFYNTIHAAYPSTQIIASTSEASCLPSPLPSGVWTDIHHYESPSSFVSLFTESDNYPPRTTGYGIFVGEYANTESDSGTQLLWSNA
ncbi:putative alpha-L-arabinofuranosidase A, partial [Lachnellula willkommii]